MTQDAPQKNMARAGSVIIPMTTFVLANLACMTDNISCHVPAHASITPAKVLRHGSSCPHALTSLDKCLPAAGLGAGCHVRTSLGRRMASCESYHDGVIVNLPSHIAIHSSSCQAISILHTKASDENASPGSVQHVKPLSSADAPACGTHGVRVAPARMARQKIALGLFLQMSGLCPQTAPSPCGCSSCHKHAHSQAGRAHLYGEEQRDDVSKPQNN